MIPIGARVRVVEDIEDSGTILHEEMEGVVIRHVNPTHPSLQDYIYEVEFPGYDSSWTLREKDIEEIK